MRARRAAAQHGQAHGRLPAEQVAARVRDALRKGFGVLAAQAGDLVEGAFQQAGELSRRHGRAGLGRLVGFQQQSRGMACA